MNVNYRLPQLAICGLMIAACGVPSGNDTFVRIEDADVPLNLASPSTTTTTSTTTTVVVPPSTTTTVVELPPDTELDPVSLYFLARDELRPVRREVETGFATIELIDLLAAGPDEQTSPGLDTLVSEGLVNSITIRRGTATVDIDDRIYNRVLLNDQTSLFAQLVLTLTTSARGVGEVTFTFDGTPDNVPTQNNLLRRSVTFDDYARLIANAIIVEPSTTTTLPPVSTTVVEAPETTAPETTSTTIAPPTTTV